MSYSEEIKTKSLEAFKSVPWGSKPGAIATNAPASKVSTPMASASDEGSKNVNSSEFTEQPVDAFRDNVNWLGGDHVAPVAKVAPSSKPASPDVNKSSSSEFSSNNLSGDDLGSSDELFSKSQDDDFGIDDFDDIEETHSEFINPTLSKSAFTKKETPKLTIRSNTRSDSSSSSISGEIDTDLQRIALVLLSKKNTLVFAKAFGIVILLLAGTGLWSDYSKLGIAKASSNPSELRNYLDSQFTYIWDTDIRLRLSDIEAAAYQQAKATSDIADYKRYLRDFPNGRYFDEVLDSIGPINQSGEVQ